MNKNFKKSGRRIFKKISLFSKRVHRDGQEHIKENLIDHISHIKDVRLYILEWILLVTVIILLSITQAYWYLNSFAVETYTKGGTYTEATLGKINSFNPLFATTSSEETLSRLLFATLSATDYSGHTGLGLAETIHANDAGDTWTVKLRSGLKWSDGQPITNSDVLYTIKTIQSTRIKTNFASKLVGVTTAENDQGELVFNLSSPNAFFESSLDLPILPAHILKDVSPELLLENKFSTRPITSGAFTVNATQNIGTEGEKIVYLTANPKYYKGAPMLDSFSIHAFTSLADIKSAIRSGTVTATADLPSKFAQELSSSNINEYQSSVNYGVFAFFNTESAIFKNKSLRQAVRLGLNFNNLRTGLSGELPLDYPLIESQVDSITFPSIPKTDVTSAKAEIERLKVATPDLTSAKINIVTIKGDNYLEEFANRIASQLKGLGLQASVSVYDSNQDFALNILRPRAYDLLIYEIGLGADPDVLAYYHSLEAAENGHNLSNYKNLVVNDLLLSARTTMDSKLRAAKYQKFLERWVEDVPAIGLYQTTLPYFVNRNVRAFSQENRLVTATDRFIDIENWATKKTIKNRTP
jgi:putative periplasmic oligopeptide-binding protein of oligopeptide ABC transporter